MIPESAIEDRITGIEVMVTSRVGQVACSGDSGHVSEWQTIFMLMRLGLPVGLPSRVDKRGDPISESISAIFLCRVAA